MRFYFHGKCETIKIEVDNIKLQDIKINDQFLRRLVEMAPVPGANDWCCGVPMCSPKGRVGWTVQFRMKTLPPTLPLAEEEGRRGGGQLMTLRWR